jgi:hypothetical protein
MENPNLLDVVVTWAGGNRSHNYFPTCLPVALFEFSRECELRQLAGRSNRKYLENQEFSVICVKNEETRRRKQLAEEEAIQKATEREANAEKKAKREIGEGG